MKLRLSILTAIFFGLIFISAGQTLAAHCYEGLRNCIPECSAAAPGSGGGASGECLGSCNEANAVIFSRGEECVKQEGEQGQEQSEDQTEDPQQQQEQPSSTEPEQKDLTSENPSPKPSVTVIRLVAGLDITEGETVTAKQGEILLIDFRSGNLVEVNSGASFTYQEQKDATTFEILKGSLRFIFEAVTGTGRRVYMSSLVATVRGTDFAVNESKGKSEVLVFDGKLAVSDVNGKNTVEVPGGYKIEALAGSKPSKPILIDWAKVDRWFDAITPENSQRQLGARTWTIVAVIVIGGLVFIFFAIKFNLKRLKKARKRI